ncbi:MAG: NTP transferase domain-containing protein, partial [Victivallales bacterium]|nr:NTP transferase domain-containing protein [Victivallales bacterium]
MSHICGFVLAAGEGRRLRPATLSRPKALVPFCGVPLLELASSVLSEVGMKEIIINACYQGDRVYEAARRLKEKYGWDIRVSMESKLLNQGGGLREGVKLVPEADHILVHTVDVIVDYDLRKLIEQHLSSHA